MGCGRMSQSVLWVWPNESGCTVGVVIRVYCGCGHQGVLWGIIVENLLWELVVVVLHPSSVEWLVLDEADKLFEPGTLGFRDQVRGGGGGVEP